MTRRNTALRHAFRTHLQALAQRLQTRLPHTAVWTEQLDETRGELRLIAPRRLKSTIRKLLERQS